MAAWSPSILFRVLHPKEVWRLSSNEAHFTLEAHGRRQRLPLSRLEHHQSRKGLLTTDVVFNKPDGSHLLTLPGLWHRDAKSLITEIHSCIAQAQYQQRVTAAISAFDSHATKAIEWSKKVDASISTRLQARGWLGKRFIAAVDSARPLANSTPDFDYPEVKHHIASQPSEVSQAVARALKSFAQEATQINQQHSARVLVSGKNYFEQVEKSPLTQEQIEAVLCFDDRVLLVAAAGSGKTSVMVAKAGYAIRQNYFTAQSILMLAFNRDAAKELGERVVARLAPLGIDAQAVATKTFHAFGMEVIGAATGRKPSVPGWLESGKDIATLQTIVDQIKDEDGTFRTQWDLFRIVLSQDLPDFGKEEENPDSYDRTTNSEGFWTLNNETVKSRGEQMIANWLFYNGVQYVYEQPYPHDTATATHSQYRPDFYFPEIDAYLEHWALDENGDPPVSFHGYKEGMAWKRKLHQQHGTTLLETTMADLWAGHAFAYLERELTALGLDLDPNPDREVPGRQPIQDERLLGTFRSFLTHTKSNRLSMADLRGRLQQHPIGQFRFRHTMFLQLFERLWNGWEKKLQAERAIDFEDMLNQAADHIEQQRWKSPYQLVMVDEFQDASQARARLVNALMQRSDSCLFAVGDDWQSIRVC